MRLYSRRFNSLLASWGALLVYVSFLNKKLLNVALPLNDAYLSTAEALSSRIAMKNILQTFRYPNYIQYPCSDAKSKNLALLSNDECLAICVHTFAAPHLGFDYKTIHDALMAVNFKDCQFSELSEQLTEFEREQVYAVGFNETPGLLRKDYVSKLNLLFTWKKDSLPWSTDICINAFGKENIVSNQTCRMVCLFGASLSDSSVMAIVFSVFWFS